MGYGFNRHVLLPLGPSHQFPFPIATAECLIASTSLCRHSFRMQTSESRNYSGSLHRNGAQMCILGCLPWKVGSTHHEGRHALCMGRHSDLKARM